MSRKLLMLCGPSGAGKSYIEKLLVDLSPIGFMTFKKLNQVTTRAKRNDEDPYIFVSQEEYDEMEDILVAKTKIKTTDGKVNSYGTIPDFIDNDNIIHTVVVNKGGIEDIRKYIERNPHLDIRPTVFMIDSLKPVTRVNRDESFVQAERESLKGLWDMVFVNDPENDGFISVDDIYEGLKIEGLIKEEK